MANLDRSLDEIIQSSKPVGRSFGPRPNRRFPDRSTTRASPYSSPSVRPSESQWEYNTFADTAPFHIQERPPFSAVDAGTKLYISNLDYGVIDEDLRELFSAFGDLKRCSVNYDKHGRSEGTAEVVYSLPGGAEAAIKSYNNVELDGKPMKIEIIGANMTFPPLLPTPLHFERYGAGPIRNGRFQGRGGGGARPHRGGGRDMRKGRNGKVSAEDLDAELDQYLASAKETS